MVSHLPFLFLSLIALWNPDPEVDYSTIRTENEFGMMQKVSQMMDAVVAVPYLCVDVKDMKLLVPQWSTNADEQWANQVSALVPPAYLFGGGAKAAKQGTACQLNLRRAII